MQTKLNKYFFFTIFYSGLLLLSIVARANTCNEGIGGTGITAEGYGGTGVTNEGYGGTGIQAEGYGGTGITAQHEGLGGTGIVGIITGFASVCVNGVEAHFDSNTQVDVDGMSSSIDKLNIGELVAIDAKGQGAEVSAQRISVVHAVVGRVDEVNTTKHQLSVLGQQIELSAITQGANTLKVGQKVAISGFVDANGNIRAMRIDQVADNTLSLITGTLVNGKISGIPVNVSSSHQGTANVQAIGNWDGKTLTAIDVKQNVMDRVMRAGYAFNAQGVVYQSGNTQALYTIGKPVYINSNTKVYGDKNLPNAVVIVRGQVDKYGHAMAKDVEYRPVERVLERGGSKERPTTMQEKSKPINGLAEANKEPKSIEQAKNQKLDKLNANEKTEKIDTSGKIKKLDKIDKPEKIEKVEKPEKVEKIERVEMPERVEAPEKPEKYTY